MKALIFDMDGVLIDSEPLHEHSKREALRRAGVEVPPESFAAYTGRTDRAMIDDLAAAHGLSRSDSARILAAKHQIYEDLEDRLQPIEGAIAFLNWAHERFRLAVATSATPRNRKATLERLGVASLFEVAIDSGQVTEPKPSPEVFQKAVAQLHLPPDECWVIEDAVTGIAAAKAAGCFAVGLTTSFPERVLCEAGADLVVDNFARLRARLDG